MYRISELASAAGISRTTLLYYEKLGLIQGKRLSNGYRSYSKYDLQRLKLIQQLHGGGLTLAECKACLDAKIDRQVLLNRLSRLDIEITEKQNSRRLLAALLGEAGQREWHETIDSVAPDAHLDWLIKQGFSEKEALRLKWLSKDMNEHDRYMADFFKVFEGLERWGPGLDGDTLKALKEVPFKPAGILEIGCGKGIATTVLAKHSTAAITAVDNDPPALNCLSALAREMDLEERISTVCASMTELPFEDASFDLIWSETSAYIMGVPNALKQWRRLLEHNGVLVYSDLVWLSRNPDKEVVDFWQKEYPDMTTVAERIKQAEDAGYEVLDHFTLSKVANDAYYIPLQERVDSLRSEMTGSQALVDIDKELEAYHNAAGQFGFQMFILRKR